MSVAVLIAGGPVIGAAGDSYWNQMQNGAAPLVISRGLLSDPTVAPPSQTHSQAIKQLIDIIDRVPQLEIPVTHRFSPGVYAREIMMPAGMTGVGHIHKHKHLNIALTGHALVTCDGLTQEIRAPFVFESMPGAQKAFQVFEDLTWITIHANPKEISDIVEMEREIFSLPDEMISAAIPVDEYRMTKRALCQD